MSNTDCRPVNFYRIPNYQKRVHGIENHLLNLHTRSPSPNRSVSASPRRHSTPPVPPKYLVDVNSPSSNTLIKYYHSYPRRGYGNQEQNSILESTSRSNPFVKEDRAVRLVTTPTSVRSFTDVLLPVAKKNRSTFVGSATSIPSDIQSINQSFSTVKRGKRNSLTIEQSLFAPTEESRDRTFQEDPSAVKLCHTKCPCRFSHCNLCHWYCSCPCGCWIACFLFGLALLTGLLLSIRLYSE